MNKNIILKSKIKTKFRNNLKNLIFFNTQQSKVTSGIIASIEKYGSPVILENNNFLTVGIDKLEGVQSIFAVEYSDGREILAGVLLFYRASLKEIVLLHIAIAEEYTLSATKGKSYLASEMIMHLKNIGRSLKGVEYITIYYHKNIIKRVRV
jgi:hypothetical protein